MINIDDYIKRLIDLKQKYGNKVILVYSKDDEGNYFDEVVFGASEGYYDRKTHEFTTKDSEQNVSINAICIN